MVGTSDERLMNLHDALKLEFQKVQRTYQDSLEKLDALALVVGKVGKGQVDLERQLVVENKKKKNTHGPTFFLRCLVMGRLQSLRVTRGS